MGAHDDDAAYRDWLVEQDVAEHEMSGGAWDGVMAASPPERSTEHWPTGPDRRFFAVDGEIPEQARRDAEHHDVPRVASSDV